MFDIKNFRNLEEHIGSLGDMPDKLNVLVVIGNVGVLDELCRELDVKGRGFILEGSIDVVLDAVDGTSVEERCEIGVDLGRLSTGNIAIYDEVLGVIDGLQIGTLFIFSFSGPYHRSHIRGEDGRL